jgi:hypothetical protein
MFNYFLILLSVCYSLGLDCPEYIQMNYLLLLKRAISKRITPDLAGTDELMKKLRILTTIHKHYDRDWAEKNNTPQIYAINKEVFESFILEPIKPILARTILDSITYGWPSELKLCVQKIFGRNDAKWSDQGWDTDHIICELNSWNPVQTVKEKIVHMQARNTFTDISIVLHGQAT